MTQKTNSLILRYGVSTLWKKKTSAVDVFSNFLQLDKLINVWLKKKNLSFVEAKYGSKSISIFVYKKFFFDERFKAHIIQYYKKTLNSTSVIQKFGVQKSQLNMILSEFNMRSGIYSGNETIKKKSYWILSLQCKRYLSFLFFMVLRSFGLVTYIHPSSLFLNNLVIFFRKINLITGVSLACFVSKNIKLRKINGFLKLKLISQSLENLIFKLKATKTTIYLKNIYLTKSFFRIPFLGQQILKPEFRFRFFTLFLSIAYINSWVLADYVAGFIKKGKQHRKNLQIFTNFFERIFYPELLTLSGFQLRVRGKLGGKLRKSNYHYKIGKAQLQTVSTVLSYSFVTSYTKFGAISVKVWLVK